MHLHRFGTGQPKVLALHGFAQQGGHFWELAPYLNAPVAAPDLPGHGPDPHLPATMDEAVDRTVELIDEVEPEVVLGYSMGGRVAMRAVLRRPVPYLVLVSATPGLAGEGARAKRKAADDAVADHVEADGLGVFIDEWVDKPMFAGLAHRGDVWQARDRELRLANTAGGVAASLRGMGQGVTVPLGDEELRRIGTPVLCLAGAADPHYVAEAERMALAIERSSAIVHPTAGHNVIGEDPGWVAIHVRRSL